VGPFLYRCPNTGFRVQGWVEDDESEDGDDAYEGVVCHACGRLHLVNPKTGETAGNRRQVAWLMAGLLFPATPGWKLAKLGMRMCVMEIRDIHVPPLGLAGTLRVRRPAYGLVIFVRCSGSSQHSPEVVTHHTQWFDPHFSAGESDGERSAMSGQSQ
jgi:hypothetical protein